MKLLLDTHAFLCWVGDDPRLSETARRAIADLPAHHRDPFDRLLVAQAMSEGLTLVSADQALRLYDVPVLW